MEKTLSQEIKEIAELETLLDKKKFDLHNKSQNHFISNLNKSSEAKLELLIENIREIYFNNSYSLFDSFNYKSPVIWESAFSNDWSRRNGYVHYEDIVTIFKELVTRDNIKTTYQPRFNYNNDTKEVLCFTSSQWKQEMQNKDMELFSGFINACAYQHGNDETKKKIDKEITEKEKLQKETYNPISKKEATSYRLGIHVKDGNKITTKVLLEHFNKVFDKYETVILYQIYAESKTGGEGYGYDGTYFIIRFAGIDKKNKMAKQSRTKEFLKDIDENGTAMSIIKEENRNLYIKLKKYKKALKAITDNFPADVLEDQLGQDYSLIEDALKK
jgi:hypothetical protein